MVVCLAEVTEVADMGDVVGDEEEELVRHAEEGHLGMSGHGLEEELEMVVCLGARRTTEVGVDWDRMQHSA